MGPSALAHIREELEMAHDEKIRGSNGRSSGLAPATEPETDPGPAFAAADQTPNLLGELARAMQSAADHERERITAIVNEGGVAHVERIRSRAAAESEELRRLAEQDVDRIKEWSTAEISRIRGEASRRTDARRASLERYLTHHDTLIATEIESVEQALRDHGEALKRFFADLTHSSDPSEIARRAGTLPPAPDLEAIGAAARAAATAGSEGPGVAPAEAPPSFTPEPATATAEPAMESPAPSAELVGVMDPSATTETDTTAGGDVGSQMHDAMAAATGAPIEASSASDTPEEAPVTKDLASTDGGSTADEANGAEMAQVASGPAAEPHGAAVRLLRSIAPWTAPSHGDDEPGA